MAISESLQKKENMEIYAHKTSKLDKLNIESSNVIWNLIFSFIVSFWNLLTWEKTLLTELHFIWQIYILHQKEKS